MKEIQAIIDSLNIVLSHVQAKIDELEGRFQEEFRIMNLEGLLIGAQICGLSEAKQTLVDQIKYQEHLLKEKAERA